ncbi:inositol 2-dehydrogenase [Palleronia sp. LCG004]|uniref:inositol 2-dehydrogenase n=1 Tax=Palleronia sp. LCG004 TaxID=3079304 RepID=UPI002942D0F8|nr:inositol 2-dehydrogenase [Palleronia sp. LCG004]WOI55876.1 inositol 2-dehydrogenase [Palleronia sp. LCG004]
MTVTYGLIGCGRIGKVHAAAIARTPGATLAGAFDPDASAAEEVTARHGGQPRSVEDILASEEIDGVLICTPTDGHADLIERAARAGKAIFCEKPIDLSVDRARACIAVAEDAGTPLMIGFQRRFDPDYRALKSRITSGAIGTVEMVNLTSRDPAMQPASYLRGSGGIFRDMVIHDFDIARWLLDDEVVRVQATGSALIDRGLEEFGDFDSVNTLLTTARGRQCVISNTRRSHYGADMRAEVLGSEGAAFMKNHDGDRVSVGKVDGFRQEPLPNFFIDRFHEAYLAEIGHFTDCLREGRAPEITGRDGLMALVLADAATRAATEGRVVEVAEILDGAG